MAATEKTRVLKREDQTRTERALPRVGALLSQAVGNPWRQSVRKTVGLAISSKEVCGRVSVRAPPGKEHQQCLGIHTQRGEGSCLTPLWQLVSVKSLGLAETGDQSQGCGPQTECILAPGSHSFALKASELMG